MIIRKFQPEDANDVSAMICRTLIMVNSKDYPEEQIRATIDNFSPQKILESFQQRHTLVATIDSKVVGTGGLKNDMIKSLFIDPDHLGKGIGKKLMQHLENIAINDHISVLNVHSSITAIGFYIRLGFIREKEIMTEKSGLIIHMTKILYDFKT